VRGNVGVISDRGSRSDELSRSKLRSVAIRSVLDFGDTTFQTGKFGHDAHGGPNNLYTDKFHSARALERRLKQDRILRASWNSRRFRLSGAGLMTKPHRTP
jgi:hypothetical protein